MEKKPASPKIQTTKVQVEPSTTKIEVSDKRRPLDILDLGKRTILFSFLLIVAGVLEFSELFCMGGDLCNYRDVYGLAIWLSIVPLLAGLFAMYIGPKPDSQLKVGILVGFSIIGATTSLLLTILSFIFTEPWKNDMRERTNDYRLFTMFKIIFAFLNTTFLVAMVDVSCCLPCLDENKMEKNLPEKVAFIKDEKNGADAAIFSTHEVPLK